MFYAYIPYEPAPRLRSEHEIALLARAAEKKQAALAAEFMACHPQRPPRPRSFFKSLSAGISSLAKAFHPLPTASHPRG